MYLSVFIYAHALLDQVLARYSERERIAEVDIKLNCEGVVCGDVLLTN